MNLPDSIKTIVSLSEFKLKEKGSLFLALSCPVQTEEEALSFLTKIKNEYYDATHHCYSYKIMDGTFKYSDDGEPSGTAGIRIYNAQNHYEFTNLLTIVIRYFGGTKLGVGPLGKAYYEAATQSLSNAKSALLTRYQTLEIRFDFAMSKTVHHFINKFEAIIKEKTFDSKPGIIILVKSQSLENFVKEIMVALNSRCEIIPNPKFEYLPISQKS